MCVDRLNPNRTELITYPPTPQLHPPIHLEERQRLDKVMAKLRAETAQGSVIALQEVSRGWAGHLHTFFARAGYHFVHCKSYAGWALERRCCLYGGGSCCPDPN